MKNKILKSFLCLIAIISICCGGITAAAVPKHTEEKDIISTATVIRDGAPYSVKEKNLNIVENDIINDHTYNIDTALDKNGSYYMSGSLKLIKANTLITAPLLTVRKGVTISFKGNKVRVGNNGKTFDENSEFDFTYEIGKEYNIVISSSITKLSLWIDGKQIIKDYSLPYDYCGKEPSIALKFSKSSGHFKNVHIWSDDEGTQKEQMNFDSEINIEDYSDENTETSKVVEVKSQKVASKSNIWMAYSSVILAVLVVVAIIIYIVIKQRRLKNEK